MPPAGTGLTIALVAEAVLAVLAYATMDASLDHTDALLFLGAVPAFILVGCAVLLYLAIKAPASAALRQREAASLGTSWTLGVTVGLVGLVLGVLVGPHGGASLAFYALLAQALAFAIGYRSLLRRSSLNRSDA